jgi:antirestriction protein ArdC
MNNFNATTSNPYSANNQEHLEGHKEEFGLTSNEWAGFHQWKEEGRKVKKGAKGCKIFMVCDKKEVAKNGEEKKKKVLKSLYVFNKDHTEEI